MMARHRSCISTAYLCSRTRLTPIWSQSRRVQRPRILKSAYDVAAIYLSFTDVIVSDPYKGLLFDGLKVAFYVGQSKVVANTTTDAVVVANDTAQVQIWIGAEDRLPRMVGATYFDEPGSYRHQVQFRGWR